MSLAGSARRCAWCLWLAAEAQVQAQSGDAAVFFRQVPDEAFLGRRYNARSTAIGDVDNDGWADVVVAHSGFGVGKVSVWRNEDGRRFAPEPELEMPVVTGGGTILGDYDNDGDVDLYVPLGRFAEILASRDPLLRNDEGVFTDVGVAAGLEVDDPSDNAIWLDYDADGFLDLYVGSTACLIDFEGFHSDASPWRRNRLFRGRGDGTFAEATAAVGLDLQLSAECGGSNGGMAAADFSGDGRVDLYVGVFAAPNRLFVQQADGTFADHSTGDLPDPGQAFGVAVGDLDGDGLPDIVQAAGGLGSEAYLTPVLYSLGGGVYVNVTEGAGLGALSTGQLLGVGLGDVDNDGDLDLLAAYPHFLFLNDGAGSFDDATTRSGIPRESETAFTVSFGDLNNDGFLDVVFGASLRDAEGRWLAYLNDGNTNHWLRVQLDGVRSNRQGIGARVVARSGDLRRTREILGGTGFYQDEAVAHLGLGTRTVVDSLYVLWPSGVIDTLLDVAADQKVRVVEGSGRAAPLAAFRWEAPDTLAVGSEPFFAVVHPALPEPGVPVGRAAAELTDSEGTTAVPVETQVDGSYRIGPVPVPAALGVSARLRVHLRQETARGPLWSQSGWTLLLVPGEDLVLFAGDLAAGWSLAGTATARVGEAGSGLEGSTVLEVEVRERDFGAWAFSLKSEEPHLVSGYQSLRFALRTGGLTLPAGVVPSLRVTLFDGAKTVDLVDEALVDAERRDWQVVDIPLHRFAPAFGQTTALITLAGNVGGTIELDDIRLVARSSPPPVTAVAEAQQGAVPAAVELSPSYPNPFNGATLIPFSLPVPAAVEVAVYDALGRRVATLAHGRREPGNYQLRWDGTDDAGRPLASGVYLCRLRAADRVASRKLLLLR